MIEWFYYADFQCATSRKGGKMKVNVLGTEYEILQQTKDDNPKLEDSTGLCEQYSKKIILSNLEEEKAHVMCVENVEEFEKKILRHEIIHAFLVESGLDENWKHCDQFGHDETMVDWIAIQFPKLIKVFEAAGCL